MSQLQTKCVFASAAAHGLLLAILVVGSAFVKPPPKPEPTRFIKLFDASKITDDETQGGGNPNIPGDATPPPVQFAPPPSLPKAQQEPPPAVKPKTAEPKQKKEPKVKQEKPKTAPKIEPPKVNDRPKITEKTPPPPKDKPKIDVSLDVKKAQPDPNAERRKLERQREAKEAKEEADRQARLQKEAIDRANQQYKDTQAALSGIVGKVDTALARTTNVEMPGPGGEAFINYADLIWTKYYQAWQRPEDHEVRSPVKVEIVVNRDGRIVSANIVSPSGDASMDKSVRQVLDRVRTLPPFPEGAKDPQRKFTIQFILKSKRALG